jgi:hypothetical protein
MSAELIRKDPFDLGDLSDFAPSASRKPTATAAAVREVAEANNFTSRQPAKPKTPKAPAMQRRRRTGRNVQFNIKTTAPAIERFTGFADKGGLVFGELFERMMDAYEAQQKGTG